MKGTEVIEVLQGMNLRSWRLQADSDSRHPYPMVRSGGLFLALIGPGLIAAIAFSGEALVNYGVFFAGAALAIVALMFARVLPLGRPSRIQILALVAAIALELVLLVVMNRMLPPGTGESVRWMWTSMIVGEVFLALDGAAKVSVGVWLLADTASSNSVGGLS